MVILPDGCVVIIFWLEVCPDQTQGCPLEVHTKLNDVGRIEICAGGIVTIGINGQHLGDFRDCVVVPRNFGAIGHVYFSSNFWGG